MRSIKGFNKTNKNNDNADKTDEIINDIINDKMDIEDN